METLYEFIKLVEAMRTAQTKWFLYRDYSALQAAQRLEVKCDEKLPGCKKIIESRLPKQTKLFDD